MEEFNKKSSTNAIDRDIVFSKSIKAGKRIYYLDVKKNRKDELFLAITESKKVVNGDGESAQVNFEKHKIFLYKEDFEKFLNGLNEAIEFIGMNDIDISSLDDETFCDEDSQEGKSSIIIDEKDLGLEGDIKIEINFE